MFQFIQNEDGHPLTNFIETDTKPIISTEHQDVVSCMVSCEGRYYSGGYDRKIVIYDVAHHGDLKLKVSKVIKEAHESAITCMIFGKDADNSWLITGSFDRVVKLWYSPAKTKVLGWHFTAAIRWFFGYNRVIYIRATYTNLVGQRKFTFSNHL